MTEEKARGLFERGRARWPELPLSFEAFLAQVRPHLATLVAIDAAQVCAEDLFLVASCLQRLSGAVDRFDAFSWPHLERHLRRKESAPEKVAELRQALLVRLFVPASAGKLPRISEYTGRGPLLVWLRMTATRLLLNARRADPNTAAVQQHYASGAMAGDVELTFIRGRYEIHFADALREATGALSSEERLLLQLRYREELTSDQIAAVLKTSRVTAHRRVVLAREALAEGLRQGLRVRLALSQTGLEQLMGLFSSSLVPALSAELRKGLA